MARKKIAITDIIKGKFLVEEGASKNWCFLLFLAGMAIVMIYNIHLIEKKVVSGGRLNKEITELKSEYTDLHKQLMRLKTESEIIKMAQKDSLKISQVQPYKLVLQRND
ncbi:MAG: FtsL-like putative cell division protein [Flavobacteriales bacterium]